MPGEGVELSRFREPEDLIGALPGLVFRATPLRASPFEVSLTTFGLGDVVLQTGHSTPHLAFVRAGPDTAAVQMPLDNVETLVLNGRTLRPRMVRLHGGGAELLRSNPRANSHAVLILPMEKAEALLCPPPGSPLLRPGTQELLETGPEAWGRAVGVVRAAAAAAARAPRTFDAEQPRAALREALLQAVRELVAGAQDSGPPGGPPRPRAWRRVVVAADEYLRAHLDRPIYTEELCAALAVSASGLSAAFHATFGLSPHRFLKLRRLAMVRTRLRSREGPAPLVKSVALSHGFWHLGQFATDYRALYGETPSETLARARGAAAVAAEDDRRE